MISYRFSFIQVDRLAYNSVTVMYKLPCTAHLKTLC